MPTQIDNIELSAQGNGEETVPNGNTGNITGREGRGARRRRRRRMETEERNIPETVNDNRVDEESAQGNGNKKEESVTGLHTVAICCIGSAIVIFTNVWTAKINMTINHEKLNQANSKVSTDIMLISAFILLIFGVVIIYLIPKTNCPWILWKLFQVLVVLVGVGSLVATYIITPN